MGALDAMAGLPFRVVAIPGLVEGGYPGVFRPDPFLLDAERVALARPRTERPVGPSAVPRPTARRRLRRKPAAVRSSPLFLHSGRLLAEALAVRNTRAVTARLPPGAAPLPTDPGPPARGPPRSSTARCRRPRERLFLSYPRADARTGRERLPSLFFAAAAPALAGRPLAGAELDRLVVEDDPDRLPLEDAVDAGERDRFRLRRDEAAATAIAAGSPFFRQSRLASQARWSGRLTRYDGLVVGEGDEDLGARLDPLAARYPVSASRLATYARCGFLYLLQNVLRLQPAPEPEERRRIDPLERGDLFHEVAERYLRELRDRGELPVRDTDGAPRAPRPRWRRRRSRASWRGARPASRCSGSARSAASTRRCRAGSPARRRAPRGRPRRTSS